MSDLDSATPRLMRAVYPDLYDRLASELERQHIHTYDVEAHVLQAAGQDMVTLLLQYGDEYSKQEQLNVTEEQIQSFDESIINFFKGVATHCHEVMVLDYRVWMNPMGPRKSV